MRLTLAPPPLLPPLLRGSATAGKRIPASVLLAAPWFRDRGVRDVDGAAAAMARYLAAAE